MKPLIYLYPGQGPDGRHYLTAAGTQADLAKHNIKLSEGASLEFYDHDQDDAGRPALLLFKGTVHFDHSTQEWYAIIDWNSFHHEEVNS
jgi:hypothetical protein